VMRRRRRALGLWERQYVHAAVVRPPKTFSADRVMRAPADKRAGWTTPWYQQQPPDHWVRPRARGVKIAEIGDPLTSFG
jgi:hypothetical protein